MAGTRRILGAGIAMMVLAGAACSSDDDEQASDPPASEESTTTSSASTTSADGSTDPTADGGSSGEGAVGSVTVDGEQHPLDRVTGITSCQLDDPSGDLTISARSDVDTADGGAFLTLTVFGEEPDSDELGVTVGETEYVSSSPEAIDYEVDGQVVSGTVDVEPLFEEGTAQEVAFDVDCAA